jgi:hypothetical protein
MAYATPALTLIGRASGVVLQVKTISDTQDDASFPTNHPTDLYAPVTLEGEW